MSGEQGFNSFLMGHRYLVQDPAPPSSLGTGSALTPNLLASGPRVERNAELIPEGLSEDRISKDWAIQSPAGRALLTVLISNSEE